MDGGHGTDRLFRRISDYDIKEGYVGELQGSREVILIGEGGYLGGGRAVTALIIL